jgi:periplasmic divalent cation tolerance protein
MNTECCLIITSTDNLKTANEIISYLVENRLAACVHLDKVSSSFYWEKQLCKSKEFRLMIKTLSSKYDDVEKTILEYHNYSLPEIIKLDITSGLPQYLDWVKEGLK